MIWRKTLVLALGVVFLALPASPGVKASTDVEGKQLAAVTGSSFNATQRDVVLERHNQFRSQEGASNMRKLSWNNTLAALAQTSSNLCIRGQRLLSAEGYISYMPGHNRYIATTGQVHSPWEQGVVEWYAEKRHYDYNTGGCVYTQRCDHYTQLVWAESRELGCGLSFCPTLMDPQKNQAYSNASFLVCHYGPRGNIPGIRPFKKGDKCSACALDQASCAASGLCIAHETTIDEVADALGHMRTDLKPTNREDVEVSDMKNTEKESYIGSDMGITTVQKGRPKFGNKWPGIGSGDGKVRGIRVDTSNSLQIDTAIQMARETRIVTKNSPQVTTQPKMQTVKAKRKEARIGVNLIFDKQDSRTTWQKHWDLGWPMCRVLVAGQLNYYCNKYVAECCPGADPDFSTKKQYGLFLEADNVGISYKEVLPSGRLEVAMFAKVTSTNDLCQKASSFDRPRKKTDRYTADLKLSRMLLPNAMVSDISTISRNLKACCNITLAAILPYKPTGWPATSTAAPGVLVMSPPGGQMGVWVYGVVASVFAAILVGLVVLVTLKRKKEKQKKQVYRQDRRKSIPNWPLAMTMSEKLMVQHQARRESTLRFDKNGTLISSY